jgi:hypothetical protein
VIFANDHPPANVHVFGDGHAKINLLGTDGAPELVWAEGMTRGELRRAMAIVEDALHDLLVRWSELHG